MGLRRSGIAVLLLAALLSPGWGMAPAPVQAACARGSLTFSSWRIPGTDGRSGWRPLAVDGNRVVMVRGPGDLASGKTTSLPMGAVQWSGGRSVVVQPIPPSGPAPYMLLRAGGPCSA